MISNAPKIPKDFLGIHASNLGYTNLLKSYVSTSLTGLSPSKVFRSRKIKLIDLATYLHHISAFLSERDSVCSVPFSLAANKGIIFLFSFPAGTKMFQFPAYITISSVFNVLAFGNPEIKSRMQIPQAYRSLPRPSSQFKPSYPSNSFKNRIKI